MPPRRSGRYSAVAYKKGDSVEFQLNGSTVKGKLIRKSVRTDSDSPYWIVAPADRRRKNEEIPEHDLGEKLSQEESDQKVSRRNGRASAVPEDNASSNSDESLEDAVGGACAKKVITRGFSSIEDESKAETMAARKKKRNSDDSIDDENIVDQNIGKNINNSDNSNRRKVSFRESEEGLAAVAAKNKRVTKVMIPSKKKTASARIGTRSTRGSGLKLLPALSPAKKMKKRLCTKDSTTTTEVTTNESVTIVKMLTGKLYLYRGERPRAKFIRFKY